MINEISLSSSYFRTPVASTEKAVGSEGDAGGPARRSIHDTVEISAGGEKIVNLARAAELAQVLPDATVDRAAFDAALARALGDISRITNLFGEVVAALGRSQQTGEAHESSGAADTARLREAGEVIVNLARTAELAKGVRAGASEGADFVASLKKAAGDINRITTLFTETLQSAAR